MYGGIITQVTSRGPVPVPPRPPPTTFAVTGPAGRPAQEPSLGDQLKQLLCCSMGITRSGYVKADSEGSGRHGSPGSPMLIGAHWPSAGCQGVVSHMDIADCAAKFLSAKKSQLKNWPRLALKHCQGDGKTTGLQVSACVSDFVASALPGFGLRGPGGWSVRATTSECDVSVVLQLFSVRQCMPPGQQRGPARVYEEKVAGRGRRDVGSSLHDMHEAIPSLCNELFGASFGPMYISTIRS